MCQTKKYNEPFVNDAAVDDNTNNINNQLWRLYRENQHNNLNDNTSFCHVNGNERSKCITVYNCIYTSTWNSNNDSEKGQ